MTIRPLHDRILARRLVENDKTAGGLFIPGRDHIILREDDVLAILEK